MDGLPGLETLCKRFGHRAQTLRWQKHAEANACRRVRVKQREQFSEDLNKVFYAPSESVARVAFFILEEQWARLFPSAVQIIERDLDSLLTFLQLDATNWTTLRTTNPIERLNKEFKRRTRAMEVTGGECLRLFLLSVCDRSMVYSWNLHPLAPWSAVYTLIVALTGASLQLIVRCFNRIVPRIGHDDLHVRQCWLIDKRD